MRRLQLEALVRDLGLNHQVFRIIQLDRRSGVAHVPEAIIAWSVTFELIMRGSTTDIEALPLS